MAASSAIMKVVDTLVKVLRMVEVVANAWVVVVGRLGELLNIQGVQKPNQSLRPLSVRQALLAEQGQHTDSEYTLDGVSLSMVGCLLEKRSFS